MSYINVDRKSETRPLRIASQPKLPMIVKDKSLADLESHSKKNAYSFEHERIVVAEKLAQTHENILPKKKLIVLFSAMAVALFLSFVDQTGITVALPCIAEELNAQETASWAGTASLISNTTFMVLFGRLSDIFTRKYVMIASMILLAFSDLACGLAQKPYQLYIFRAICGIGNGGITSLTMVIVSDVVSLRDRGKYQGILGSFVGLGNSIGPILASAFISHSSWRNFYFMLCPTILCAAVLVYFIVPSTKVECGLRDVSKTIDYLGVLSSSCGIIFLLIPISGGGFYYAWSSPLVISFLCIGGLSMLIFVIVEKKIAVLPMIPPSLFNKRLSLTCLMLQNFFFGMCYYSSIYYFPFYFEVVRGKSVIISACLLVALVIPQSISSILSGQIISRTKRYIYVIWGGYICWTTAVCLLNVWDVNTKSWVIVTVLVANGIGIGMTFQPTMVAAQAQSYKRDRATLISTRNVLRSFGGAIGLAISSNIISNNYSKALSSQGLRFFTADELALLKRRVFSTVNLEQYSGVQVSFVREAYMKSLKNLFYFWMGCMVVCLVSTLSVKDRGLDSIDEEKIGTSVVSSTQSSVATKP